MQSCRHEMIDLQGRHLFPLFYSRAPGHEYPFLLMNALALVEPLPEVFAPDIEMEGRAAIGDQDEMLLIGTEGTYPIGIGGINSFGQRFAGLRLALGRQRLAPVLHLLRSRLGRKKNVGIAPAKSHRREHAGVGFAPIDLIEEGTIDPLLFLYRRFGIKVLIRLPRLAYDSQ